jgi:hypothetical protein
MKVRITKKMALAIRIALDELDNSGIWEDSLPKKERKKVYQGIEELEMLLKEIEQNKKEK